MARDQDESPHRSVSSGTLASLLRSIDVGKVIGPRIELANMISKIDMDKVIGPRIELARLTRAFDDQVAASVMRGIRPESVSGVATAAAAALTMIDLRQLEDAAFELDVDDETALELPDRLIELGIEGLEDAPEEVLKDIEESLEEANNPSRVRVPIAIGVAVVVGAFAFVAAIHNSLVAAESPEAERFVSSFFDHLNFYVAVAFLMLALRDRE